ncbi:MAG: hypothetical protein AAFZ15_15360 [Bacteroidota bacterium]
MKSLYYSFVLLIALALFAGCETVKKLPPRETVENPPSNGEYDQRSGKGVPFIVFANGKKLKGAFVTYNETRQQTDETGRCYFKVKSLGRPGHIFVSHPELEIQASREMLITDPTEIHLSPTYGDLNLLEEPIKQQLQQKKSIEQLLAEAEKLLDNIEREILDYQREHPNSLVPKHLEIVKLRRTELNELKAQVKDINRRYAKVIQQLDKGDLVDIGKHEMALGRLHNYALDFQRKVNKTVHAAISNIMARPDAVFSMNVFFSEGEYRLDQLTPAQRSSLDSYIQRITNLKSSAYSELGHTELETVLQAIGYADGVPVSYKLELEIEPLCNGQFEYQDPNSCLSYLRAQEILNYIAVHIEAFEPHILKDGKGSELAGGSTHENPLIRKCQLSFFVVDKDLTRPTEYGKSAQNRAQRSR